MDSQPSKRRRTSPRNADSFATARLPTGSQASRLSPTLPKQASGAKRGPEILQHKDTAGHNPTASGDESRRIQQGSKDDGKQSAENLPLSKSSRTTRGGMAAKPRRSSIKPTPREFPPTDPGDDDALLEPFIGREASNGEAGEDVDPDAEGELPPTPSQKTKPPAGIHNVTPTKKKPRKGKLPKGGLGGSPLKRTSLSLWRDNILEEGGQSAPGSAAADGVSPGLSLFEPSAARGERLPDRNVDKVAERDRLKAELERLEKDMRLAEEESERARKKSISKSGLASARSNPDELLQLLGRHLLPHEQDAESVPSDLLAAALNPISFLPFGNAPEIMPDPQPKQQQTEAPRPPPVSHQPVKLSAEEELPFLQMLVPFSLSQTTSFLPRTSSSDPLRQRHVISFDTTSPPGLFSAQAAIIVDTSRLEIQDLSFPRLDPAAEPELRPFLDPLCSEQRTRSITRNVCIASWAMGEWVRVAQRRAKFWCGLSRETRSVEDVRRMVARMRRSRRKGKRQMDDDSGDEEADENGEDDAAIDKSAGLRAADILPYMGLTAMETTIPRPGGDGPETFVRIQWHIKFDWTGDASSNVSLLAGMPGKWVHADERSSLGSVIKIFRDLVDGGEKPLIAMQIIVALLAGDEAA